MKKLLLILTLGLLSSVLAVAQTYQEKILVNVNGQAAPETVNTIEVTKNADGTCDFLLRNFVLVQHDPDFGDMSNPVGNIRLKGVKMVDKGSYTEISTTQTIQIEAGDDPNVENWMGPELPEVPIVLNGKMNASHLFASIQIDLTIMKIDVTIGQDFDKVTSYSESILVNVNGQAAPETVNAIEVTKNADGTCDFLLRNFVLVQHDPDFGDMSNPVGNIRLKGVKMVDKGSYTEISTEQTIQIEAGDDPSVENWMGPELPEVPIVLNGKMNASHLFAAIQIDLTIMKIDVTIGQEKTITAIQKVTLDSPCTAVYNLNGIRVAEELNNSLPAGIYIVNGKKTIVK